MNAGRYVFEELLSVAREHDADSFRERLTKFQKRYPKDLSLMDLGKQIEEKEFSEEDFTALEEELCQLVAVHKLESGGAGQIPLKERRKFSSSFYKKPKEP
ncbi:MAG: hypothetical protein ABH950_03180 [Candidatus Altiarchaeota archaeon]